MRYYIYIKLNLEYTVLQPEYRKRGYNEVITPNMYNTKLWERSGHLQNYEVGYNFLIYFLKNFFFI